ncbi:MAG: type II toxin-antitoxin system RelE family toxin [Sporichthyaceae bacterium]
MAGDRGRGSPDRLRARQSLPVSAGVWSARRGAYRLLYRLRDDTRELFVLRVEHRTDVHRPR